jgi:pimeloyl-ACP methyl ester carboxylesterase
VRKAYGTFGPLDDAQWRKLTEDSVQPAPGGGLVQNYDPRIGDAFHGQPLEDVDLWPVWDAVAAPVLLLRGAGSDLLHRETAEEMLRRGPPTALVEVPEAGHAPALLSAPEIAAIRRWLDDGDSAFPPGSRTTLDLGTGRAAT